MVYGQVPFFARTGWQSSTGCVNANQHPTHEPRSTHRGPFPLPGRWGLPKRPSLYQLQPPQITAGTRVQIGPPDENSVPQQEQKWSATPLLPELVWVRVVKEVGLHPIYFVFIAVGVCNYLDRRLVLSGIPIPLSAVGSHVHLGYSSQFVVQSRGKGAGRVQSASGRMGI
jgi:hypothetical protein